jgi:Xaa-Pro aminopeptidase
MGWLGNSAGMFNDRIKKLRMSLQRPLLIKKKENLLYLTGRSFLNGYLLVKPKRIDTDRGRRINTDVVFLGDGLEKIEGVHSDFLKNVGMYVPKNQTLEVFSEFTYAEVEYIKTKNPKLKIRVIVKRDPVDYLRMIKEPDEVALIRTNMRMVEKVFNLVKKEIKRPGMTEIRLAKFIRDSGLKFGAEDVSFPPIVASGKNAAVPHHVPSGKRLKPDESIILDFGFKYKNYCSDFTRTVFLKKVPKRLEMAYNQVEKAYNQSMEFISCRVGSRPYPTGEQVYRKSVDVLAEKRLDKYFIHSLGHGTGLEIHELPNLSPGSKDILKDGMVFSIEPGVYIPKFGGIRIEDLVYLENGKVKKFINVPALLKENIIN